MTIIEAINETDKRCPNQYEQKQKIKWLSRLEAMIHRTVLSDDAPALETMPLDTELVMEQPWDEGYVHWLEAQIHLANQESDLYNASASLFTASFEEWKGVYIQSHMPADHGRFRF